MTYAMEDGGWKKEKGKGLLESILPLIDDVLSCWKKQSKAGTIKPEVLDLGDMLTVECLGFQ
jgi:hypothetical protein